VKISVKDSAKCQKKLEIEVPKELIEKEFDKVYTELQKNAEVPGFRKGKAPRHMLEEHFGHKASERALSNLINEGYHKAIEQENIHPVQMPEISNVNFDENDKLTFEALVDIKPVFELKNYKGLKIKKASALVTDEDVDKTIELLRDRYAQYIPVETRGIKIGDYVICDFSYYTADKLIEEKKNSWLLITKEMFIPGLDKKLEGIKKDEEKEFEITLPKYYKPEEFAGKKVKFKIKVNEIKEKKLPALDDEFAKMAGKKTMDEIRVQIRQEMEKEKQLQVKQDMRSQLIDGLVKAMPLDVPPSLLAKREESLKQSTRERMRQSGLTQEQMDKKEKQLNEVYAKEALKQLRIYFIMGEIAEKEKITVEEQDMTQRIEDLAKTYNQNPDTVFNYLEQNNLLENMHSEILEEKIISFLIDNAKVEESK